MDRLLLDAADRWAKEVRKGTTRLVVLSRVAQRETYGYALLSTLRAASPSRHGASEATLYPLLHDLEADGHLASRWAPDGAGGPTRKYYRITRQGLELFSLLKKKWKDVNHELETLIDEA